MILKSLFLLYPAAIAKIYKLHKISSNDADSFLFLLHQVVPDLSTRVWARNNWYKYWMTILVHQVYTHLLCATTHS